MAKIKKKKHKGIIEGIRKPIAPPSKSFDTSKKSKNKRPKHKKPIQLDE